MADFKVGEYVLYKGRICIVSHIDEYGLFLEDVERDESLCVTLEDAAKEVRHY